MDKETDRAFVQQGFTRHVENLRFHTNNGSDGVGNNIKGTQKISDETEDRTDLKCITALHNKNLDVIYYYLASTSGLFSKVLEYDINSGDTTTVLHDELGVLNLDKEGYITGINEIDGLLYWAEWGNNVRKINVERAKTYGINGFTEDDLKVILRPPLQKLNITLENTDTESQEENNILEKFIYFSYRYRYLDGGYSVLAPFTNVAFEPKNWNYNFSEQSNPSMINAFNQVSIDFFTGSKRVTEIQLVFKESESNNVWVIDDFNKANLGYNDNEIQNFKFNNQKVKRALEKSVLANIYDNVPLTSKSQEIIDRRLLYGYYKEYYNIKESISDTNDIDIDYELSLVSNNNLVDKEVNVEDEDGNVTGTEIIQVPSGVPKKTVKSNRDYQAGLVYGDDDGRITTILNSKTDTLFIPNSNSVTENSIHVTLKHKPPYWATYFRFFIKQNEKGYDQILPTLFYEDGVYRWIKLEGADIDKVKEGDYLIVKSDTQAPVEELVKVKVLEVKQQEQNFLQIEALDDEIVERAGLYFKIKPEGFRVDIDDYENFEISTYDNTRNAYNDPVRTIDDYISAPHFYGDTLDDLSSNGYNKSSQTYGTGTYTGANDERNRYLIEIDGLNISGADTFRWSDDNGANWIASDVPITAGIPQALNNGVEITFANNIGHSLSDEWTINARSTWSRRNSSRAYGFFRTTTEHFDSLEDNEDEIIRNGARIYLEYDEYGRGNDYFKIDIITQDQYDNIEEWFHKEDILDLITAQCGLTDDDIHFMRGNLRKTGNGFVTDAGATEISQDNLTGTMTMCVRSVEHGTGTKRVKVRTTTEIIQNETDYYLIFETEPIKQPDDIYFEIGKNYKIIDGFHTHKTDDFETLITDISTDQSQTASQDLIVKLDWFNAFSYGNAVESYKIKDQHNRKGIDVGVRTLSDSKEKYKEVTRDADITWSDVYNDETDFNGLNTFNLSLINFIKLDKEDGTIQKLLRLNDNLIVFQEDAIGILPYNKNIIYDAEGGKTIGVSNNVLDRRSYRPYDFGKHGVSKSPESVIRRGSRTYLVDEQRGDLLRMANDGITTINENLFEHEFSNLMRENKGKKFVAGFDPIHNEYLIHIPSENGCLLFKEKEKGFPQYLTFEPDFMLNANNELYAWKDGVMYKMNATENRNNFFGVDYPSKIKYFANTEPSIEKTAHAIGIESSHPFLVNISTKLTSRTIDKESFVKKEDYWFSEIMGNTNGDTASSASFGLGQFPIINGEILTDRRPETMSIGDYIVSANLLFSPNEIIGYEEGKIILSDPINTVSSFLIYEKNQNIDGNNIRGDVFEIEMINNDTEKIELRATNIEVSKSDYT